MNLARSMNFDAEAMETPVGRDFTEICRIVAGMTGEATDSMLSSLPSELCFNDLRDSGRRHAKAEKTCPHNIHAVAHTQTPGRIQKMDPLKGS